MDASFLPQSVKERDSPPFSQYVHLFNRSCVSHARRAVRCSSGRGDGATLLERSFTWVTGYAEMPQVIAALEAERVERNLASSFMPWG